MIPVEARKYVPMSLSEVTLDWFPIAQQPDKESTRVLLAAIHHDALRKYHSIVEHAKLSTKYTEMEIFSAVRSSVDQEDETVALIDLGAGSTKLYVATKGIMGKTHNVRMGGADITNVMAKDGGLEFNVAENLKRHVGLLTDPSTEMIRKSMYRLLDRGFRELHQVITRHTQEEGTQVEKIILCGSGAMLRGIDVYATDRLQIPTEFADPFSKVAYPAFLEDTLKDAGPAFSVATGAALRILSE